MNKCVGKIGSSCLISVWGAYKKVLKLSNQQIIGGKHIRAVSFIALAAVVVVFFFVVVPVCCRCHLRSNEKKDQIRF